MKYDELLKQITPELYATFKRSLELGRWPDGREMTEQQREHCLAAVIAYDEIHKTEIDRVGYLPKKQAPGAGTESRDRMRWVDDTTGGDEDGE